MSIVPFFTESTDADRWDRCSVENSLWNMVFGEDVSEIVSPYSNMSDVAISHDLLVKDARAIANTDLDWFETPEAHVIQADLPGLTKDDVQVIIENQRVLQIMGKANGSKEFNGEKTWHRAERASREGFLRRLQLPANVKASEIKAHLENGVLSVTVPKLSSSQFSLVQITDQ